MQYHTGVKFGGGDVVNLSVIGVIGKIDSRSGEYHAEADSIKSWKSLSRSFPALTIPDFHFTVSSSPSDMDVSMNVKGGSLYIMSGNLNLQNISLPGRPQ